MSDDLLPGVTKKSLEMKFSPHVMPAQAGIQSAFDYDLDLVIRYTICKSSRLLPSQE